MTRDGHLVEETRDAAPSDSNPGGLGLDEFHPAFSYLERYAEVVQDQRAQGATPLVRHLRACRSCRARLDLVVRAKRAEEKGFALRAMAASGYPAAISLLLTSDPRAFVPIPFVTSELWPELDAVAIWFDDADVGLESLMDRVCLLRDVLTQIPESEKCVRVRSSLRSSRRLMSLVVRSRTDSEPVSLRYASEATVRDSISDVLNGFFGADDEQERSGYLGFARLCDEGDEPWSHAADALGELEGMEVGSRSVDGEGAITVPFRRKIAHALQNLVADRLTTEVIGPLSKKWDRVAIYLLDNFGGALEVAASSETTAPYTVRYPIGRKTTDVVADVFKQRRVERIQGGRWDQRFNRYLFETGHYEKYKERLFVPIIMTRSRSDCSVDARPFKWLRSGDRYWELDIPDGVSAEAIGTLSLSLEEPGPDIEERIEEALAFASSTLPPIAHGATMRGFCEIVLANLINDLGASHGALHVGRSVEDVFNGRVHDVTRVQGGAGGVGEVPRQDGFGAAAVRDRRCVHFHRRDLELRNPKLAELGIRQTTVLPLLDAARNPFGVLYLHHDEPSTADVDEYADIASEALGVAIHTKRCALSPTNLLAEARGFTMPLAETLEQRLTRMAGFTANLLGCDHVSIVVKASGAPLVVHYGRYILRRPTNRGPLDADLIALSSMDFDGARYIGREEEPYPEDYARGRFVEDELIQATAVLPMWERGRALMVVDYRAPQGFGQIERELHESAAGLIARAISAAERDDADRELRSAVSDLVDATARAQTDTPTELHLGFERGSGWKPPA